MVQSTAIYFVLRLRARVQKRMAENSLARVKNEQRQMQGILEELAQAALSLEQPEVRDELSVKLQLLKDNLSTEEGQLSIAKAELEAFSRRTTELDAMADELKNSSTDSGAELEMLQSQERSIAERNEVLRSELEKVYVEIDSLVQALTASEQTVDLLTRARTDLGEAQTRLTTAQDGIAALNKSYVGLKKSYDALDIEYAQLYEKQNAEG